jgi:HAD superfamily hydrolase (TIGR01509 family)
MPGQKHLAHPPSCRIRHARMPLVAGEASARLRRGKRKGVQALRTPIRAVLWDIDGTLVDSEPNHHRALLSVCRSIGLTMTEADGAAFVGISYRDMYPMLSRFGTVTLTFDDLHQAILDEYIASIGRVGPREGAVDLVKRFAAMGLRQACVSNSPHVVVDANLRILNLPELAFAVGREDVVNGKPDPEGYLLAAKRLGLPPEACAVVEDSPTGVRAAKAAGMLAIAWPQNPDFVFEAVDHLVSHPAELDWPALCAA